MSSTARLGVLLLLVVIGAAMWGLSFLSKHLEAVAAGVAPLPARSFERLSLISVGTGGTFENPRRRGPCLGVGLGEHLLLVDAGRGVAESLRASGIPAHQPEAVLLTSLLPENTTGLDDLWLTGWLGPRTRPLQIYGPAGTRQLVAGLQAAHALDARALQEAWALPEAGGQLRARELSDGDSLSVGGIQVRVAALSGGPFAALVYRFQAAAEASPAPQSTRFGITTVGFAREQQARFFKGVQLLASEAIFGASLDAALAGGAERPEVLRREAQLHWRLEELGAFAQREAARALVLVRLRPPPAFDFQYERVVHQHFRGGVIVAEDGQLIAP